MKNKNETLSKFERLESQELKTLEEKRLAWERRPEEEKQKYKRLHNRIDSLYDYGDSQVGVIKDQAQIILRELSSGDVPEYDWEDEIEKEVEDLIEYLSKQLGTLY